MSIDKRRLVIGAVSGLLFAAASFTASQAGTPTPGGWAIVQSDGSLGFNQNVTDVGHPKTGVYRINFNQDVSHCAATATIAAKGGKTIIPGYIVVGRNGNVPNQLRVFTFATVTLIPSDYKFDVVAHC